MAEELAGNRFPLIMTLRISFSLPQEKQVIIFYTNQETNFQKYLLKDIAYDVIEPYKKFCLHPKLIIKSIKNYIDGKYTHHNKDASFSLKTSINNLYIIYLISYIELVNPKVILTAIDDSSIFQKISNLYKDTKFIAIQNGLRLPCYFSYQLPYSSNNNNKDFLYTFYCFSQSEKKSFLENGFNIKKFIPIGSFNGGIYWKNRIINKEPIYDICYISQWFDVNKESFPHEGAKKLFDADVAAVKFLEMSLIRLIDEYDYSLTIALRNEDCSEELEHFKSIFGNKAKYILSDKEKFSSYNAADSANLIINIYSTLGAEAMGFGKKVLFCNGSNDFNIGLPAAEFCYYEGNVYNEFKEKVVELLSIEIEKYQEMSLKLLPNIMQYSDYKMPHEIIRSDILNMLKNQ